jgi:hypothetical protein
MVELAGWPAAVAEEHRRGVSKSTFPAMEMMVSLLLKLGGDLSNPLRCEGLLAGIKTALSLQFGKITLHFPNLQGETGWLRTASTAN